ncbi:MAG: YhcN/YlaJ family sporulation lipoprotein [Candidatus Ventricola sp.]
MKKGFLVLLCIVMAGMVLSGCAARTASGTTATAAPIMTNSPMATTNAPGNGATVSPEMSPDMNNGAAMGAQTGTTAGTMNAANTNGAATSMTPAQAGRLAEQIADAVERISEINDAEVVIGNDSRVLVAVEFEDQYQAGLDDRMKQMIVQAVQKVDDGLKDIEITDDDTLYGQVKGLGERLANATGLDELADDFGDLWDRITGR